MFHPEDTVELEITEEDLKVFPDHLEDLSTEIIQQVFEEEDPDEGKASHTSVQIDFEYLAKLDSDPFQPLPSQEEFLAELGREEIQHFEGDSDSDFESEEETQPCVGSNQITERLSLNLQERSNPTQNQTQELPTTLGCQEEALESGTEEEEGISWKEVTSSLEAVLSHTGGSILSEGITWRHKKRNKRRSINRKYKRAKLTSKDQPLPLTPWNIWAPSLKKELSRLPTMVALNFCEKLCKLLRNAPV